MAFTHSLLKSLLLVGIFSLSSGQEDICRALVLSGGADKGAYESGAIYQLTREIGVPAVSYDVVSGVSAGAINAMGMTIWPIGMEMEMTNFTNSLWLSIHTSDIWTFWPEGIIYGLTEARGLVNTAPLLSLLTKVLSESEGIQRRVNWASMDADAGEYHPYDEHRSFDDILTVVLASASFPGFFPPVPFEGMNLMDGGTTWGINLVSAVNRCLEIVDDPSKIVMDMVLLKNFELNVTEADTSNALNNFQRYRDIKSYYETMEDVYKFMATEPHVQYRYFFHPSEPLTTGVEQMLFSPELAQSMIDIAVKDVKDVLAMGEGAVFEKLKKWMEDEELRAKFQSFEEFVYRH